MTQDNIDLIERYLDGQASPAEAAELMKSMKADPSLAADMEALAAVRNATDEDLALIELPPHLYGSIVNKALATGVLGAASATTAATGGTAASTTLVALLVTATSVALMSIWTAWDLSSTTSPNAVTQTTAAATASDAAPVAPEVDQVSTLPQATRTTTDIVPPVASNDGSVERARPNRPAHTARTTALPVMDRANTTVAEDRSNIEVLPVQNQEAEDNVLIASLQMQQAERLRVQRSAAQTSSMATQDQLPWTAQPYTEPSAFPSVTLRILQRPLSGFSYNAGTTESAFGSLAFEADVELSNEHYVGAGVHRDLFPLQLVQTDNSMVSAPYMTWYGAHYRWMPMMDLPLGARPFFHLGAGGSSRGVTVQPALGLQIPVSQLQLGVGADVVGLAYQNNGVWGTAFSPALRIELGYRW